MSYAGYRLLARRNEPGAAPALAAWAATVAGLTAYPAAFFGGRNTAAGLGTSAAMCAAASATVAGASRLDPMAAGAMVPLALWTGFATVLSEELWRRN